MARPGVALCVLALLAGCAARRPPSVLLFVMDTTRADAVSAYGRVAGTTPVTDVLAATGLRYAHAWAQAPWTLPSHATLFTGLLPAEHGVGWRQTRAPDGWTTLAGTLGAAGYETFGVAENIWVSQTFNLVQGFDRFVASDASGATPDVRDTVARWARERPRDRPFFLFVNVLDSHAPYRVRDVNRFLPPGIGAAAARRVDQRPERYFCRAEGRRRDLEVLWGLYLGNVAAADAKLGAVLHELHEAGLDRDLVTVVTADHGEHFGEHGLVSHQFSVRESVLRVPLVVHGLSGTSPGVVEAPVGLVDLMPTILGWAGVRPPAGRSGRRIPTRHGARVDDGALVVGEFATFDLLPAPAAASVAQLLRAIAINVRSGCRPEQRVFGAMRTIVAYPYKLNAYERYPEELYHLGRDPGETQNLATSEPARVAALSAALARRVGTARPADPRLPAEEPAPPVEAVEPDAAALDRLRALGYVGADAR